MLRVCLVYKKVLIGSEIFKYRVFVFILFEKFESIICNVKFIKISNVFIKCKMIIYMYVWSNFKLIKLCNEFVGKLFELLVIFNCLLIG